MDLERLTGMLRQTFSDGRIGNAERRALRASIRQAALSEQSRAVLRARAFDLARDHGHGRDAATVLDWLEDVSKLLLPPDNENSDPLAEAHFSPGEACVRRIVALLDGCRDSADLCVFTITDNRITDAIRDAKQRAVAVRIVTDNDKLHDPGSDILGLARLGIPVRVDDSPYHMHHKFALFDAAVVLTGSYNWTRGAADNNEENLVISNDRRLLAAFSGEFERLWQRFAAFELPAA